MTGLLLMMMVMMAVIVTVAVMFKVNEAGHETRKE